MKGRGRSPEDHAVAAFMSRPHSGWGPSYTTLADATPARGAAPCRGTTYAAPTVPRWVVSTEGGEGLPRWGQPSAQDTGTQVRLNALARRLAEAARSLQRQESPQQVLDGVVNLASAMVPGADEATITMVRTDRHCYSAAASSEWASDFDVLQDETGEGPCLDAIWRQETVREIGRASCRERV